MNKEVKNVTIIPLHGNLKLVFRYDSALEDVENFYQMALKLERRFKKQPQVLKKYILMIDDALIAYLGYKGLSENKKLFNSFYDEPIFRDFLIFTERYRRKKSVVAKMSGTYFVEILKSFKDIAEGWEERKKSNPEELKGDLTCLDMVLSFCIKKEKLRSGDAVELYLHPVTQELSEIINRDRSVRYE